MLEPEEVRQQVEVWNRPSHGDSVTRCLHENFEALCPRKCRSIAVLSGPERITYGELDRRAAELAAALRDRGLGPDVMAALYFEPGHRHDRGHPRGP